MRRIIANFFCLMIFYNSLAGQTGQLLHTAQAIAVELGPAGAAASAAMATTAIVCEALHNHAVHISKKYDLSPQPVYTTADTIGLETGFVVTGPDSSGVTQAPIVQSLSPTSTTFHPSKIFIEENIQIVDTAHDTKYDKTGIHDRVKSKEQKAQPFQQNQSKKTIQEPIKSPVMDKQKKLDFSRGTQTASQESIQPKQEYIVPQVNLAPQKNTGQIGIRCSNRSFREPEPVVLPSIDEKIDPVTDHQSFFDNNGRCWKNKRAYQQYFRTLEWFRSTTKDISQYMEESASSFEKGVNAYLEKHRLPQISTADDWQTLGNTIKEYFLRANLETYHLKKHPGEGFLGIPKKIKCCFSKNAKKKLASKHKDFVERKSIVLSDISSRFDDAWVWANPYMSLQQKKAILAQRQANHDKEELHLLQEIIANLPEDIQEELRVSRISLEDLKKLQRPHGCGSTVISGIEFNIHAVYDMLKKSILPSDIARIIKYSQPIEFIDPLLLIYVDEKKDIAIAFDKNSKTIMLVDHYTDMIMLNSSSVDRKETDIDTLSPNNINHIKNPKHKWKQLVPDEDWDKIKEIIKDVINTGEKRPYKIESCWIMIKVINGKTVEVTYKELETGENKIGNAWVK